MENKDCVHRLDLPSRAEDMGLAVKDGVREMRFNLRRGARQWMRDTQARVGDERSLVPAPLALLGEPLELAVRTTARLLRTVDRAAVELLSSDGGYRSLETPLRSSASYFDDRPGPVALRHFTQDHFWRYRHWLEMQGRGDVFVREQGIERAAHRLCEALPPGAVDAATAPGDHLARLARIIEALAQSAILVPAAGAVQVDAAASTALAWRAAACAVLAGELGDVSPGRLPRDQAVACLSLADEIMTATRHAWSADLAPGAPVAGLVRWLHFALRHA